LQLRPHILLLLALVLLHQFLLRLRGQPAGSLDQAVLDLGDLVLVVLIEVGSLPNALDPLQIEVHFGAAAEFP